MKKFLQITIPILSIIICLFYVNAGNNVWTQLVSNTGILWSVQASGDLIITGSQTQGIWRSTNGGVNWATSNTGLNALIINAVGIAASSPNIVYCGTGVAGGQGMYKSTDAGVTWTQINSGITQSPQAVQWISVNPTNPNNVLIAVWDGTVAATDGIYQTTNGGANWFASNTGIVQKNILSLARNPIRPNTVYAGSSFDFTSQLGPVYIYKSYDGGYNWVESDNGIPHTSADINPIRCMSASSGDTNVVLAATFLNTVSGGIFITTNGGALWTLKNTGAPNTQYTLYRGCFIRTGSSQEMYVGIDRAATGTNVKGIFRTLNQGNSWTDFTGGSLSNNFIVRQITMRTSPDSTLYACGADSTTAGQGVFGYTFNPLGIHNPGINIPKDFSLYQNYPNPFNPTTTILYDLPKNEVVSINVYDLTGKMVKTILNESKQAGSYSVTFDASSLSSGVYFYKIIAGSFVDTKKMILVK